VLDAIISINTLGTGVINSISGLISGGLGYVATEVLSIDNGAFGVGATITIDSVDGFGTILTYTLTTNGSGYTGPGGFLYLGGSGTGADLDIIEAVDFNSLGRVLSFTITNGGLYDIAPIITIPVSLDGAGLVVNALIADCPTWNDMGLDCSGALVSFANGIPHGEVVAVCVDDSGLGGMPPEYSEIEEGCCIPEDTEVVPICVDYHIENLTGAPQPVQYTGCTGIVFTAVVPNGVTLAVCAIIDGVVDPGISGLDITTSMAACAAI